MLFQGDRSEKIAAKRIPVAFVSYESDEDFLMSHA